MTSDYLSAVPTEILRAIVSNIVDDTETLRSLSLVAKRFQPLAQEHLFYQIGTDQLEDIDSIIDSPRLLQYVQSLCITGVYLDPKKRHPPSPTDRLFSIFIELPSRSFRRLLPRLRLRRLLMSDMSFCLDVAMALIRVLQDEKVAPEYLSLDSLSLNSDNESADKASLQKLSHKPIYIKKLEMVKPEDTSLTILFYRLILDQSLLHGLKSLVIRRLDPGEGFPLSSYPADLALVSLTVDLDRKDPNGILRLLRSYPNLEYLSLVGKDMFEKELVDREIILSRLNTFQTDGVEAENILRMVGSHLRYLEVSNARSLWFLNSSQTYMDATKGLTGLSIKPQYGGDDDLGVFIQGKLLEMNFLLSICLHHFPQSITEVISALAKASFGSLRFLHLEPPEPPLSSDEFEDCKNMLKPLLPTVKWFQTKVISDDRKRQQMSICRFKPEGNWEVMREHLAFTSRKIITDYW